ncbi:ADCY10 [Symbiodinium natans]|uniref:ADCY10 protein n=1 Tax=Symbiodinium natans TaxID=878477 RepID=A0A812J7P9_9DINO|nr:ADCY10 [Symbiodinium natans]
MSADDALPGQIIDETIMQNETLANVTLDKLDDSVKNWLNDQNTQTLNGALAFVPFILQQAFFEGNLDEKQIVIHKGSGGVVFSDASGFTALTEKLAKKSNGAELLSQCLTAFFTPLIDLINAYRGDTIKFSGDALTIYFPSVDDTKTSSFNGIVPPHGSFGLADLGPMATAVLRASACCIEIHKRLHMFETGVDDVRLCLHIGVGCGEISILQVGGIVPPETHIPRIEYLISGAPLEQISIAEPLAKNGETCLSPQAWELVKDCVIEGRPLEDRMDFHLLLRMDESKYTFPTIKYATQLYDTRVENCFKLDQLNITRRYIPSAVFKQIECGTLQYVNEMRNISVIFINGSGLDVMSSTGPAQAQELMSSVQKVCYAHEGTLNKFLIDDKGMLFLLVFGLPPLVHPDDPARAVLASMELVQVFKRMDLIGRFGVTTGRSYCGVCGSAKRMEYTVLGDCVNLSARLMANAPPLGVLTDEETSKHSTGEIDFKPLAPIKVKGKTNPISIFQPTLREGAVAVGITADRKIRFPWYDNLLDGSTLNSRDAMATAKGKVQSLCSIQKWPPNMKVAEMLGSPFSKALHSPDQVVGASTPTPRMKAPANSPFAEGGLVVIEGATGLGKIELAEHIATHCALQFQTMPVFGTMGPRPGESTRMAVELLRSLVAVYRTQNPATPADDVQALAKLIPSQYAGSLDMLKILLSNRTLEDTAAVLEVALKVIISLLAGLKNKSGTLVVLQFEQGTSLFEKTAKDDLAIFWRFTSELSILIAKERSISGLVLVREARYDQQCVKDAAAAGTLLTLKGLNEEHILEYMANYLGIPEEAVPPPLRRFVSQVTMGNPLYIRETLDQLSEENVLKVKAGTSATLIGALEKIDISAWNHTAMVGGTVCNIESLDPIEMAALKMSTCFEGPFTLPDLAASNCSQWGGSTHFDLLRLFRATRKLVSRGFIDKVPPPRESPRSAGSDNNFGDTEYFFMQSALIRTVGASMVLEAQRKSVKRNALIDRVLKQDLPERMTELAAKKSVQHIPWYYERALRRMLP